MGHAVNNFSCVLEAKNSVAKKKPLSDFPDQKRNRYSLRRKVLAIEPELMKKKFKEQLLRKISPPVNSTQSTQRNSGNAVAAKSTSISNNSKTINMEVTNQVTTPETLAISLALD